MCLCVRVSEWVSASAYVRLNAWARASEWVSDCMSVWVSEWASMRKYVWVSEWVKKTYVLVYMHRKLVYELITSFRNKEAVQI